MILRRCFSLAALGLCAQLAGCTAYNPYTGQQEYDPNATALAVGGLAVAGTVAAVAASNNNNNYYYPAYRPGRPGAGGGFGFDPYRRIA